MALGFFGEGERVEFVDVALDFGNAGAGPVGAPEDFIGDFLDAWKVFEKFLRRDAGDVHIHVFVTAYEKEGFVHPERAAAVCQDDDEIGIIDADIVAEHWLGVKVSGAREDGGAGVNHDWQIIDLGAIVDGGESAISLHVAIGGEDLVRRMKLQSADAELGDAIDFRARIGDGAGKNAAEDDEAVWRSFAVVCAPVVDLGGEADDVGCDVIDEAGALDAKLIEKFQEGFRVGAVAFDVGVVLAAALDQVKRVRLHHVEGHDVDVNVDDGLGG